MHESVNKPKSRAVNTACGPQFLSFKVIVFFLSPVKVQACQEQTVPKKLGSIKETQDGSKSNTELGAKLLHHKILF